MRARPSVLLRKSPWPRCDGLAPWGSLGPLGAEPHLNARGERVPGASLAGVV